MRKLAATIMVSIVVVFGLQGMAGGLEVTLEHFEPGLEKRPGFHAVRGVALSPDESLLYAAHWQSGVVVTDDPIAVFSTANYTLLEEIPGGSCVGDAVVSNDGRYVYAPTYYGGYISRYDTLNSNAKTTIDLGDWAVKVWKTPNGDRLIVLYNSASGDPWSSHYLALIDISGGNFNTLNTPINAGRPLGQGTIAFSENFNYMYVAASSSTTEGPALLKVSLDGSFNIVDREILSASGWRTGGVVRAGGKLYVGDRDNNKIHVINEGSFDKIDQEEINLPYSPWNIALHPDGQHLFILYGDDGRLSVMDLQTGNTVYSLTGTDGLNPGPEDIEFSADGTKAYVAHSSQEYGGVSFLTLDGFYSEEVKQAIDQILNCANVPDLDQLDEVLVCGSEIVGILRFWGVPIDALAFADSVCDILNEGDWCDALLNILVIAATVATEGSPIPSVVKDAITCIEDLTALPIGQVLCEMWLYSQFPRPLPYWLQKILVIITASPVDIKVIDKDGNELWIDENDTVNNAIPSGAWILRFPAHREIAVINNPVGIYEIKVVGRTEAIPGDTFDLTILYAVNEGDKTLVIYENVPVQSTSLATTSSGEDVSEFVLKLDIDGDGVVDENIKPTEIAYNGNFIPKADAGSYQTVSAGPNCMAFVTLDGSGSSDAAGDPLTYDWSWEGGSDTGVNPTIQLPLGTHTITLVVNDGMFDSQPDTTEISVVDTTPPAITVSVTPDTLWPPNHKMASIQAAAIVTDNCYSAPTITLESISMNEGNQINTFDVNYDNTVGDGHTLNDIQNADFGTEDYNFYLRAERAGTGTGRIYTVIYSATDASGNTASASALVTVPHNQ